MSAKKVLKSRSINIFMQYICNVCDYSTSRKDNYKKHLGTAKHKRLTEAKVGLTKVGKVGKVGENICEFCGKKYKHRQSLFKHKRISHKLFYIKEKDKEKDDEIEKLKKALEAEKTAHFKTMKKALIEKQKCIEVTQKLAERPTQQIFCFLNNDCKDAIPIMKFIENLKFKITDINTERPL